MSDATDGIGLLASYLEHAARQVDIAGAQGPAMERVQEDPPYDDVELEAMVNRLGRLEWTAGITATQEVLGPEDPPGRYEAPGPKVMQPVQGGEPVPQLPRTNRCIDALGAWREYALELEEFLEQKIEYEHAFSPEDRETIRHIQSKQRISTP